MHQHIDSKELLSLLLKKHTGSSRIPAVLGWQFSRNGCWSNGLDYITFSRGKSTLLFLNTSTESLNLIEVFPKIRIHSAADGISNDLLYSLKNILTSDWIAHTYGGKLRFIISRKVSEAEVIEIAKLGFASISLRDDETIFYMH